MIQIGFNIVLTASMLSLVAISATMVYYMTNFFSLTQAATISLGAYFSFLFFQILHFPFTLSVLMAVSCSIGIDLLIELFVFRPMRNKSLSPFAMLIVSIGLYVILQNFISLFFGDDTKIINTTEVTIGNQIFGAYVTTIQIIMVFVSIALIVVVNLFLHYTATGKSIRAVSSNPELCNIYGISSNKIILIAFGIGSALAVTAGILSAMDTNMTPTFGFNLLLYGVVAMIIGGVGSTRGLIAGALLVATAQNLAAYYIDTKWMDAITYIILILFLIWKPLGFSGKRLKKVEV